MDETGRGVEFQVMVFCNVTIFPNWRMQATASDSGALNRHFVGVGQENK
jgi:hypothetical protein